MSKVRRIGHRAVESLPGQLIGQGRVSRKPQQVAEDRAALPGCVSLGCPSAFLSAALIYRHTRRQKVTGNSGQLLSLPLDKNPMMW